MNWEEYKIGDFCDVGRGSSPRPIADPTFFEDGNIPWIKIADATASGRYIYSTKEHVNEHGASFSRHLEIGSLIIAASGVSLGQIKLLGVKGCVHDGWLYLSNYKEKIIDKDFLYYQLLFTSENFHSLSYGAAIQNINSDILKAIKFKLPPVSVQRRIAQVLGRYDALIENYAAQIRYLEASAQNLYAEWFVRGRCPFAEYETGAKLPVGWERVKFTEVVSILSGGTPKTDNPNYWNGDVFWFSPADLQKSYYVMTTEKTITESGLKNCNSKLYPKNTVVITARGTVGRCVLLGNPMAINQSNYALIGKGVSQFFVFLKSLELAEKWKKEAIGAVFETITIDNFERTEIVLPNPEILEKFDKVITPIFSKIENLQSQTTKLRQMRDKLLPRLLSGRLEVKVSESTNIKLNGGN